MSQQRFCKNFMIIIFGPTAVGKSDFAVDIAKNIPAQIVNCDIGQFYTPLTIGTAKPDWKNEKVRHHLFDIVNEPRDFDVSLYRELLLNAVKKIWSEGDIPILVGGSGFYLKSIFFPPIKCDFIKKDNFHEIRKNYSKENVWDLLDQIDPERAAQINKNDLYRINRALDIWEVTGQKPSTLTPIADFPSNFLFLFLNRERKELYERIDTRVIQMIQDGWIEEVKPLIGTNWESFLKKKKLIGYDIIIDYIKGSGQYSNIQDVTSEIQKRTRNYAKRQITFWNMLEKQLKTEIEKSTYSQKLPLIFSKVASINLTLLSHDLYIKQLINDINALLFN